MPFARTRLTLSLFLLTAPLFAQTTKPPLTFEVASIHPTKPGETSGGINATPGGLGYTAKNATVKLMISLMYKIPMRQIEGGPPWLNEDRYDVEARADGPYSLDDLHTMFQNLLADRFNLKFHILTKEGNVYALTIDPAGLKMKPNTTPPNFLVPIQGPPTHIVGNRVPMPYLCWWLGQNLQNDGRPVVDQTGLTGNFDFTTSFLPPLPPGFDPSNLPPEYHDLPTIFTALKDQLGLKLTPQKGPVDQFIIDHLDKPSAN